MTSDLKELQKAAYEGKKAIQNMVDTERPDGQKVQAQATGRGKDSVYDGEFGDAYGNAYGDSFGEAYKKPKMEDKLPYGKNTPRL